MNWKIEQFHFSESRRTLTAGSQVEALEPLVCAVLVHLCRHPDEVVTRDALVDAVWRGRVVTDNAVNRVIVKLRSAFGDDARNPKFIVTQSKTGYRLIAPVEIIRPHTSAGLSTARYKVVGVALVIATMIGLSTVLWHQSTGPVARSAAPLYRGGSDEYGPVVSPDGRTLAYSSFEEDQLRLYLRDLRSGEARRVDYDPGYSGGPSWSSNGRRLVYLYTEAQRCQFREIAVSGLTGSEPKTLHNCPVGSFGLAIYGHQGDKLYYSEAPDGREPYSLFELDIESGDRRRLLQPVPLLRGNTQFDLHPYRDALLISSPDQQQWLNIYELDLANQQLQRLFRLNEYSCCAIWNHDGSRVSLQSENPYELVSFDLSGADRRVDYRGVQLIGATTRFPNAEDYVFIGASHDADIVAFEDTGLTPATVVNSSVNDHLPAVDPAGRQLVFLSDRSGQYELWVTDLNTGKESRIDSGNGDSYYYGIGWAPDGKRLAAFNSNEIDVFNWPAGKARKLRIPQLEIRGVSWKDAETLAYSVKENDRWVVKHYDIHNDQVSAGPARWAYVQYGVKAVDTLWYDADGQTFYGIEQTAIDVLDDVQPLIRRRFNAHLVDGTLAFYIQGKDGWRLKVSRQEDGQWTESTALGSTPNPSQVAVSGGRIYVSWLSQSTSDVFRTIRN